MTTRLISSTRLIVVWLLGVAGVLPTASPVVAAFPTITVMPESSIPIEQGQPIIGEYISESSDPVDVFFGKTVGFWGFSNGGSVESIPLEPGIRRTFLVARWRLDFEEPTPIGMVAATTWGHQDGQAQMRLLDENHNVLGSGPLAGYNTLGVNVLTIEPAPARATYYLDLFDYSRDIRFITDIGFGEASRLLLADLV